jgi:hypothetical protein
LVWSFPWSIACSVSRLVGWLVCGLVAGLVAWLVFEMVGWLFGGFQPRRVDEGTALADLPLQRKPVTILQKTG